MNINLTSVCLEIGRLISALTVRDVIDGHCDASSLMSTAEKQLWFNTQFPDVLMQNYSLFTVNLETVLTHSFCPHRIFHYPAIEKKLLFSV